MKAADRRTFPRRWGRRVGLGLLLMTAAFLVGRAAVEIITVNPTKPQTYQHDWGGPHYLGVLLVHAGPGVLILALAVVLVLHTRSKPPQDPPRHPDNPQ